MSQPEIILHRAKATRSFTALWLLEELGLTYEAPLVLSRGAAGYRGPNPNPSGFVPTLVDGGLVIFEAPAICIYLADRYGYGTLAPRIEDQDRGRYLSWLVYSTAQLEPARGAVGVQFPGEKGDWGVGWRPLDEVLDVLVDALKDGPFLLGERFSAADVMIGATLAMGMFTGQIPARPQLAAYTGRLAARPAYVTAASMNWGSD